MRGEVFQNLEYEKWGDGIGNKLKASSLQGPLWAILEGQSRYALAKRLLCDLISAAKRSVLDSLCGQSMDTQSALLYTIGRVRSLLAVR